MFSPRTEVGFRMLCDHTKVYLRFCSEGARDVIGKWFMFIAWLIFTKREG